MASKVDPEEADLPSEEQAGEEPKRENGDEKAVVEVVTKEESGKKSKKKRGKKKQDQESGPPVSAGEASAVRSMRELLTQLGVTEQIDGDKPHVFWDTQPVPKLGKCSIATLSTGRGGLTCPLSLSPQRMPWPSMVQLKRTRTPFASIL